jgi:hypothetical protein
MTEDDAGVIEDARQTEPYRPSNGCEGMDFMAAWCDRCKRDAAFQAGTGDSCPIAANAIAYMEDEPEYPKEWVCDAGTFDGNARCTAFELHELAECSLYAPPGIIADARQIALPFHA